jgi:hypothetical protein
VNQFLLFLRSIAVSIAVFLVLAFFAAKIFGGTLFPKPPRVDFPAVAIEGQAYFLSVTREEGKDPAFSLRRVDPTDAGQSVLVAPQSSNEADAWAWAQVVRGEPMAGIVVEFTQRDGKVGRCAIGRDGKLGFSTE